MAWQLEEKNLVAMTPMIIYIEDVYGFCELQIMSWKLAIKCSAFTCK